MLTFPKLWARSAAPEDIVQTFEKIKINELLLWVGFLFPSEPLSLLKKKYLPKIDVTY